MDNMDNMDTENNKINKKLNMEFSKINYVITQGKNRLTIILYDFVWKNCYSKIYNNVYKNVNFNVKKTFTNTINNLSLIIQLSAIYFDIDPYVYLLIKNYDMDFCAIINEIIKVINKYIDNISFNLQEIFEIKQVFDLVFVINDKFNSMIMDIIKYTKHNFMMNYIV